MKAMDRCSSDGRLESLDVLRGFDMFFIFLADPVPCICWTFLAVFGLQNSWFGLQFEHISGNGLRFYDCIFPLFLFISGVAFPFSYAKQVERGMTAVQSSLKAARRAVTLFFLGAMLWTVIDRRRMCRANGRSPTSLGIWRKGLLPSSMMLKVQSSRLSHPPQAVIP